MSYEQQEFEKILGRPYTADSEDAVRRVAGIMNYAVLTQNEFATCKPDTAYFVLDQNRAVVAILMNKK